MIIPFRCLSMSCRDSGGSERLLYFGQLSGAYESCPRCGEKGFLKRTAPIHLIQQDSKGQIASSEWASRQGIQYEFLCEQSRKGYAGGEGPSYPKSFTHDPTVATCTACLLAYGKQMVNAEMV